MCGVGGGGWEKEFFKGFKWENIMKNVSETQEEVKLK
jgi:hypothetical protein